MKILPWKISGSYLIQDEPFEDHRGRFTRTFCEREFAEAGLETRFVQQSVSRTVAVGAIRGLHFQRPPHAEVKLVRCLRGAIWDVCLDLRSDSPTYGDWCAQELTAENGISAYLPAGCAHGFQTLMPESEVQYLIHEFYVPEASDGVRFDDPQFQIPWPLPVADLSARDSGWPSWASRPVELEVATLGDGRQAADSIEGGA